MKLIVSTLFGVGVGISGVFLHNSYRPFGLVVSLIAIVTGAYLLREMYRSTLCSWLFLIGWALVVVRGSTVGNGGELLVEANLYGNSFVLGGAALMLIFTLRAGKAN
ncbi:MAG: hypothetical protein EBX97_06660 [Actinobacteria bacterium]|nr:hypothetical protein [Actinomycetota bacterium]